MINIDMTNIDIAYNLTSLFQWDYGQKLSISGLSLTSDVQVHFARDGQNAEIRLGAFAVDTVTVAIPDEILKKSGMFKAYIYSSDGVCGETIKVINLNVREREQPTDYTSPEYIDVVAEMNEKLNQIIETGIADYQPDPILVENLVTAQLDASLGKMATKDEVTKPDLAIALAAEIDGKLNTTKIVTNLAVTEYGFVPDAKTVSDAVKGINNNLANKIVSVTVTVIVNGVNYYTLAVTDATKILNIYPNDSAANCAVIGFRPSSATQMIVIFDKVYTATIPLRVTSYN